MMGGGVLSPGDAAMILFGLFFLFMFLRVPVAFALGLACLPMLVIEPRLSAMTLVQETFNAYNSFILLAVPFFLLTANLMNVGCTTDRLLKLSRAMVGHWPGGRGALAPGRHPNGAAAVRRFAPAAAPPLGQHRGRTLLAATARTRAARAHRAPWFAWTFA